MLQPWISYSDFFSILGLKATFSTRNTISDRIKNDRIYFAEKVGLNPSYLAIPNQIHSSHITQCDAPGNYSDSDGIISRNKDVILSIQVADCFPVFFCDLHTKEIALAHAGWRGLVSEIIPKTIQRMMEHGSKPQNIRVVLGPSIKACCFEVSSDVLGEFDSSFAIMKTEKKGKYRVDLLAIAMAQLARSQIHFDNIFVDPSCTFCDKDSFFSFRRDGKKAGRMLALFGWDQTKIKS
ncbi:MAG: peptidoglycan editing factor PgeF [Candidatus Marinimicrobia bacterium]|jgi:hypothetical protein|nr:peptidoglycan editing factor PgeF [Candidatus Neomarinimicrobiota bacterium]MBT3496841.1 peptidoglycan editing factor PgeF [Candidatus Neomarinimicrobiota bacterium]MBT3692946.1 peptidoglycan editing factor PgeF [Candidatus Neomarinimicrobiota bacterium]MBT3732081.1 peptidoglycan editing factor PgeF [Candidatus Neomarinimicrobiota bacterium]MBT4144337.1 peptidoglycan editing factor PgeF [Candidatus Neomarinimicrobiota bacterium]